MKFPVIKAFKETYAYLRVHARQIARVIWPAVTILLVWSIWFFTETRDLRDHLKVVARTGDKAQYLTEAMPLYAWDLGNTAVSIVIGSVIAAALLRPMLRGGWNPQTDYLDFSRDEFRLMGAVAVVNCIDLILFLARTFTNYSAGAGIGTAFAVTIWLYVRLSLVQPAAVDGHGIGVSRSIALTGGNFLRLLGFALLIMAPIIAALVVLAIVVTMFSLARNIHSGAIMFPEAMTWMSLLTLMIIDVFGLPLSVVGSGVAYRLLSRQTSAAGMEAASSSQPR